MQKQPFIPIDCDFSLWGGRFEVACLWVFCPNFSLYFSVWDRKHQEFKIFEFWGEI